MTVHNELERMWEEVVVAIFKVLPKHLHGGTKEKHQKIQDSLCHGQYPNWTPPEYK
jgi:hypothetical protein